MIRSKHLLFAAVLLITAVGATFVIRYMRAQRMPYADSFAQNRAEEWHAYGGVWRLKDGVVINRSDERGVKITTGSFRWSDYQMTADMELLGHDGEVGMLLRVNSPETGINSYHGYYVGIRAVDNALTTGVGDHDWIESRPVAVPGGVHIGQWYRMHAVAVGCELAVQVINLQTQQTAWASMHEDACQPKGQIGLRSLGTGAAWKNVAAAPATMDDLQALRRHAAATNVPEYPLREDDYARMKQEFAGGASTVSLDSRSLYDVAGGKDREPSIPLSSIKALNITHSGAPVSRLRGVVTLADPLYVQDASGGIAAHLERPTSLNFGDEVELTGKAVSDGATRFFNASGLRLLWDRTLIAPVSISSTQAASGAFEGSLVELSGELVSKKISADGTINLELADLAQNFRVVVPQGLSQETFARWQLGSDLRVSGICTAEPASSATEIPFRILPGSVADVHVIATPPWTRGRRLFLLIAAAIVAVAAGVYLFFKIERWKMRGIMEERERLAVDMHDTLAQSFAGLGFHLQSMRRGLREHSTVPQHLMQKLDVACEITAHTHREASARIAALHPSSQVDGDLLTLLQKSTTAMLSGGHLPLKLERSGEPRPLSLSVRDALFGMGREAIANVLRHSRATQMTLRLHYEAKGVELVIADNGAGFDERKTSRGFGLQSIAARGHDIGATVNVLSTLGQGTTLVVFVSYPRGFSPYDWMQFQWRRITKEERA